MNKSTTWILSLFVAFIFVQSTFFKFSGAEETRIIFGTIADWMSSIGFPALGSSLFRDYGAYAIGTVELIASALILIPATRVAGAAVSLAVISGAIFFHLFTPLGVDRVIDQAGNTDGGALFFTAVGIWVSSIAIIALNRIAKRARTSVESAGVEPLTAQ